MLVRASVLLGLFGFVCLAAPLASAQNPPPADLKKKSAQELRDLGNKLFGEQNYLGALAVYKEAYERFPNVKILLNIGITLNKLERFADAANAFQRYIDDKDAEAAVKPELEKAIVDIDKTVGVITLEVSPADAQIQVNDSDWIVAPKIYRVPPGSVTLNGKKDGYRAETKTLSLAAGEKQTVTLGLSLLPRQTDTKVVYVDSGIGAKVEGPRARIGAFAMEHLDIPHSGAATLIGVTFDAIDRLRIQGAAILGPNYGAFAGATLAILTGKFRPIASVGMPMFFSDGARFGMRGAGGLELQINRHLALVAEVGVEFLLNPEDDIKELVFIPAVGAIGRL